MEQQVVQPKKVSREDVEMYIFSNIKFFPGEKIPLLKSRLLQMSQSRFDFIRYIELKDPTTMFLVSFFLGGLGIDRFMLGDTGMGILKLLTGGVCGILALVDLFTISNKTKEYNYHRVMAMVR